MRNMKRPWGDYEKGQQALFETWFEHIKEELSQDAAGNLQEQIDDIKENPSPEPRGELVPYPRRQ